jgi:hypothetical protein
MLDRFFESYYRLRPVTATFTGIHEHDHRLPDWSPDGLASAVDEMKALRVALDAARPPAASLHDVAERDRQLAISFLDIQIAEHEGPGFQRGNPSLAVGEAVFGVTALMTRPFAPVERRAESAIARLTAFSTFLDGARQSIAGPVPDAWRLKCLRECHGAEVLLVDGIPRWIAVEHIDDAVGSRLADAADAARAAVDAFQRWLEQAPGPPKGGHYVRDTTAADVRRVRLQPDQGDAADSGYACGADLFDLLLTRGHWCDCSRASLLTDARKQLDETLARLDERARQIAPGGWPEVQHRLLDAHPTRDEYLPAYQRVWNACRERALACDLVTWPDAPIRYVPIPVQTRDAAPFLYYLHYRSPAPFDRLPTHDYVVTPIEAGTPADEQQRRLRATNTSVITLNHVIHHGAIGHHVQNSHAYAGPSEIGRVAAIDGACRIGMFLGGTLAEGWACYATDLMDEVGFLTPEESLAQQHTRARLLARAVVDIELHQRTMGIEDAVALYRDRIGMADEAARAEACKNSMFPGTALMYWLGTDGLHQLRRERQRVEGASFSLRRFHDRVLSFGSIPVPLIARVCE